MSYLSEIVDLIDRQKEDVTYCLSPHYGDVKVDDETAARLICIKLQEQGDVGNSLTDCLDELIWAYYKNEDVDIFKEIIQKSLVDEHKDRLMKDIEDTVVYLASERFPVKMREVYLRNLPDSLHPSL